MSSIRTKLSHIPRYKTFWGLVACVFVLDQLTKLAIIKGFGWQKDGPPTYFLPTDVNYIPGHDPVSIIPGTFYLVCIDNPGAAFSLLSGWQVGLSLFALIALAAIFFFRRSLELERRPFQLSLGILVGGIVGNLFDRIARGCVIDFLDVHIPIINYRWPAFNIADCAIVVGVILYLFFSLLPAFGRNHPQAKRFNEEEALDQ